MDFSPEDIILGKTRAENDEAAVQTYELFQAYVRAGFTEEQALTITTGAVSSMVSTSLIIAKSEQDGNV
jgi:hypothetical protein